MVEILTTKLKNCICCPLSLSPLEVTVYMFDPGEKECNFISDV